ncbi:MAG: helix-turn-helix domain-containing protein [Bacteroidales bacterium]|nr:helix-turn-helix domain-containing protein [Bacteroidales bacterium]
MANSKGNSKYTIDDDILATGLNGNDLTIYALIHSYCKHGQDFFGSIQYIMERTNTGRRTVLDVLQRLIEKGFIEKVGQEKIGVSTCTYRLGAGAKSALPTRAKSAPVQKQHQCEIRTTTSAETAPDTCGNRTTTGAKSAPVNNNVIYDKSDKKDDIKSIDNSSSKDEGQTETSSVLPSEKNVDDVVEAAVEVEDGAAGRKKSSAKRKKYSEAETELHRRCREAFEGVFVGAKGTEYYWTAKDSGALVGILKQIRFHMEEADRENVETVFVNFQAFISLVMKKCDEWTKQNFSPTLLNSKFNEIYSKLKNNTKDGNSISQQAAGQRVAARDDNEYLASILADLHAGGNQ